MDRVFLVCHPFLSISFDDILFLIEVLLKLDELNFHFLLILERSTTAKFKKFPCISSIFELNLRFCFNVNLPYT